MSNIIKMLNDPKVIQTSGFMIGFMYEFKFRKKTLDNPLSAIFIAAFSGIVTSINASYISACLPEPVKCVIPITGIVACIYYKINEFNIDKEK